MRTLSWHSLCTFSPYVAFPWGRRWAELDQAATMLTGGAHGLIDAGGAAGELPQSRVKPWEVEAHVRCDGCHFCVDGGARRSKSHSYLLFSSSKTVFGLFLPISAWRDFELCVLGTITLVSRGRREGEIWEREEQQKGKPGSHVDCDQVWGTCQVMVGQPEVGNSKWEQGHL